MPAPDRDGHGSPASPACRPPRWPEANAPSSCRTRGRSWCHLRSPPSPEGGLCSRYRANPAPLQPVGSCGSDGPGGAAKWIPDPVLPPRTRRPAALCKDAAPYCSPRSSKAAQRAPLSCGPDYTGCPEAVNRSRSFAAAPPGCGPAGVDFRHRLPYPCGAPSPGDPPASPITSGIVALPGRRYGYLRKGPVVHGRQAGEGRRLLSVFPAPGGHGRHRGDDRRPADAHDRLQQLPGPDHPSARSEGRHRGHRAIRHVLHRLAFPERHAEDAPGTRDAPGGLRRQGGSPRLQHRLSDQPGHHLVDRRPRRRRDDRQGRPRQHRRRLPAVLRQDAPLHAQRPVPPRPAARRHRPQGRPAGHRRRRVQHGRRPGAAAGDRPDLPQVRRAPHGRRCPLAGRAGPRAAARPRTSA